MIPFNKPYLAGNELAYIKDAVDSGHLAGNGKYTRMCQDFFMNRYGFKMALLTTSCTDALELASMLLNIQPGDEVIIPSFTFVSTALVFARLGAKIVFVDSRSDHPGLDEDLIEPLITSKTKAIVPVHYAGIACDMDKIMKLADKYGLFVIEDAAQAIDSFFLSADGIKRPLGSIGHLGVFSFHENKNIQCGEGGMLVINDERFFDRSEVLLEKGTNRSQFFRGEINKYEWVDIGSSFLPSELNAAFLLGQLEHLDRIQEKRKKIWNAYQEKVTELWGSDYRFDLPVIPGYATNNWHIFYLVFFHAEKRTKFIEDMKAKNLEFAFHYQSLHKSPYYSKNHDGSLLPNSERYADCLVRLPIFFELEVERVFKTYSSTERSFCPSPDSNQSFQS